MKFRVRGRNNRLLFPKNFALAPSGEIVAKGGLFGGYTKISAKPEFLIGKDSLGNDVYENDTLMSETTTYTAGFNMDMGAYLEWENGSRIPFKQCVEKLVLRERE